MEKKLPKGWVETELGNVAFIQSGGTPSRSNKEYWNGNIPWLKISDFKALHIDEAEEYITEAGLNNSSTRIFPKGTILFTIFASIGKIALLNIEASTNQAIVGIKPTDLISKKFVVYSLKMLSESIQKEGKGVAQKNINQKILKETIIYLPPLAEQERIVNKLDELFARIEVIKKSMDKIPQLLKDFRQQVLTSAVTGKLTEDYETEELNVIDIIRKDREQWYNNIGKKEKVRKIIYKVNNNKNHLLPFLRKEYDITFIEEISAKKPNALKAGPFGSSLKKDSYVECGYKIYGQEQVIREDPYYGDYYIDENKYNELIACKVEPNDLLISLVGTIGKSLVLPEQIEEGIINPRLLKFSFHEKISSYYIKYYLDSQIAKDFIRGLAHGGVMDVINMGILKQLPIPLPPLKEQEEIVKRVESLFAKADRIEEQYKVLKEKIDILPQLLLHKAFKGELVEQLPNDGDAADLLKEIMALKKEGKKEKEKEKEK